MMRPKAHWASAIHFFLRETTDHDRTRVGGQAMHILNLADRWCESLCIFSDLQSTPHLHPSVHNYALAALAAAPSSATDPTAHERIAQIYRAISSPNVHSHRMFLRAVVRLGTSAVIAQWSACLEAFSKVPCDDEEAYDFAVSLTYHLAAGGHWRDALQIHSGQAVPPNAAATWLAVLGALQQRSIFPVIPAIDRLLSQYGNGDFPLRYVAYVTVATWIVCDDIDRTEEPSEGLRATQCAAESVQLLARHLRPKIYTQHQFERMVTLFLDQFSAIRSSTSRGAPPHLAAMRLSGLHRNEQLDVLQRQGRAVLGRGKWMRNEGTAISGGWAAAISFIQELSRRDGQSPFLKSNATNALLHAQFDADVILACMERWNT
jgi:hypothetical protein